jgi:hypothetical protein
MSEFSEGMAVGQSIGNNGGNCGWNNDWWILLLLLCGWGNNGWSGNGGGNQMVGYELGRVATTNDVASGFSTSAIMANQNDMQLAMQQGFAGVQQTLCQGFSGINQSISDCCCQTQRSIDGVNYNMAKNTCDLQNAIATSTRDIIDSQRCGTDRILNYLTTQEMDRLRAENQALRFQASQSAQNAYLIDQLRPTARPAYLTCSPFDSAYGRGGWNNGWGGNWNGCDCCG